MSTTLDAMIAKYKTQLETQRQQLNEQKAQLLDNEQQLAADKIARLLPETFLEEIGLNPNQATYDNSAWFVEGRFTYEHHTFRSRIILVKTYQPRLRFSVKLPLNTTTLFYHFPHVDLADWADYTGARNHNHNKVADLLIQIAQELGNGTFAANANKEIVNHFTHLPYDRYAQFKPNGTIDYAPYQTIVEDLDDIDLITKETRNAIAAHYDEIRARLRNERAHKLWDEHRMRWEAAHLAVEREAALIHRQQRADDLKWTKMWAEHNHDRIWKTQTQPQLWRVRYAPDNEGNPLEIVITTTAKDRLVQQLGPLRETTQINFDGEEEPIVINNITDIRPYKWPQVVGTTYAIGYCKTVRVPETPYMINVPPGCTFEDPPYKVDWPEMCELYSGRKPTRPWFQWEEELEQEQTLV